MLVSSVSLGIVVAYCFYIIYDVHLKFLVYFNLFFFPSTLQDSMVWVEALIPFDKGEFLSTIHKVGMVERTVSTVFQHLESICHHFLTFGHSFISKH